MLYMHMHWIVLLYILANNPEVQTVRTRTPEKCEIFAQRYQS